MLKVSKIEKWIPFSNYGLDVQVLEKNVMAVNQNLLKDHVLTKPAPNFHMQKIISNFMLQHSKTLLAGMLDYYRN